MDMEQAAMIMVMGIPLLPAVIIGIVLCFGRGADFIAGYNTSSPAERDQWNEKALCRGVGVLVLLIMGCIAVTLAGAILGAMPVAWTGVGLLVLVTAGGLLFINKSKRFKKP